MKSEVSTADGHAANSQHLLSLAADQAKALAQRGSAAVREQAQKASESTVAYIQEKPVKAVMIAAATGAALTLVIGMLSRSRRD